MTKITTIETIKPQSPRKKFSQLEYVKSLPKQEYKEAKVIYKI